MRHSKLFRFLRAVALAYFVGLLMVAAFQSSLIYFPRRAPEAVLIEEARDLRLEPWRDAAGSIIGWKSRGHGEERARHRLLVFHGNAGYALHRAPYLEAFEQLGDGRVWEVYLFEYPGYGARPGAPGEKAITEAALAALETLRREDGRPVFLLGESIGSAPACAVASREPEQVGGLLLWTPLASLTDVAAHHYPFLPVRLLLRDRWENTVALQHYHGPVGVRVAELDEVVTPEQGKKLYDAYAGPKRLWLAAGAGHNTIYLDASDTWWSEATAFVLGESR
jgi:pimeloyl-ACP methyl ester carboxylesterase